MSIVTVFVATMDQAAAAARWRGHVHFPQGDQQCYALQGPHSKGAAGVVGELTKLGYDATCNRGLGAVIVVIPRDNLETAGREIQKQLRWQDWSNDWVTNQTRHTFGD